MKRSELISKFWSQFEKKNITTRHFLSIMANVNNEILYDEKIILTDEIDLKLSNETLLINGDDIQYVAPNFEVITNENNEGEILADERPQLTRKRKAMEINDPSENVPSTRKKRKQPAIETIETVNSPIQTRSTSKRTVAQSMQATEAPERSRSKQIATRSKTKQNKRNRAHESDDDSDLDLNMDTDTQVYEIMERISRNGPAMVNLRKRFAELEKNETISFDPKSFKCIICVERKKNTILFPFLHQHTCGPCWIIWKIQQINAIPLESIMNDETYEAFKPKCPICRQGVDEFKEAKN